MFAPRPHEDAGGARVGDRERHGHLRLHVAREDAGVPHDLERRKQPGVGDQHAPDTVRGSVHPALVVLPLLGIPSLVAGARAQRLRQRAWEGTVEDKRLSDHVFGLRTTAGPGKEVCIFGLADEVLDRHGALRRTIQLRERRAEMRAIFGTVLGWLAYAVGYAGAVVFTAVLAVDGRATVGDVLLVISLSGQIQFEFSGAVQLIGDFIRNLRSADHYLWPREYADRAVARRRPSAAVPDRLAEGIRFEGVSFRYPGTDVDVLQDVDLAIGSARTRRTSSSRFRTGLRRCSAKSTATAWSSRSASYRSWPSAGR